MLQTGTPVNRVCRYVRGPLHLSLSPPPRTHPASARPPPLYPPLQRSTLPYCKFYRSCIKLWSWPGIDPARPPTIWIRGPRAYTLCTFLIKRYCNCGLTSKHHGLQQHLPTPPFPPTSRDRRRRCSPIQTPAPWPLILLPIATTLHPLAPAGPASAPSRSQSAKLPTSRDDSVGSVWRGRGRFAFWRDDWCLGCRGVMGSRDGRFGEFVGENRRGTWNRLFSRGNLVLGEGRLNRWGRYAECWSVLD